MDLDTFSEEQQQKQKNNFTRDQYRFYFNGRQFHNGILKSYYKIEIANTKKQVVFRLSTSRVYDNLKTFAPVICKAPVCLIHDVERLNHIR